jgi:hypothetical protein
MRSDGDRVELFISVLRHSIYIIDGNDQRIFTASKKIVNIGKANLEHKKHRRLYAENKL